MDQGSFAAFSLLSLIFSGDKQAGQLAQSYVGCFGEGMLAGAGNQSSLQTPQLCVDLCSDKGFSLAGLKNGSECYCGNELKEYYRESFLECSSSCAGNSIYKCGGERTMNVYRTGKDTKQPYSYLGCFEDSKVIIFKGDMYKSDLQTPDMCMDFCHKKEYRIAGLKNGKECYCSNEMKFSYRRSDDECFFKCPGDHYQKCGGQWRMSIYRIGQEKTFSYF